jgi:hypothetical protein
MLGKWKRLAARRIDALVTIVEPMDELRTSRSVAPEDIRRGDYIAILQQVCEYVPLFVEGGPEDGDLPRRILMLPKKGGLPLRVIEVCLPFLLVEQVDGTHATYDARGSRFARLTEEYARVAIRRIRADRRSGEARDSGADTESL